MAVRIWKSSLAFTALLAGTAVLSAPALAQVQERGRMDHDIAENGGRDREGGPRPQGGRSWGGDNGGEGAMPRSRPAPPPPAPAPAPQQWQRPAQSWNQPAPQAAPPPAAGDNRAYTDNRGAAPRQQGWDGQRWTGQNWDRGAGRANPAARDDERPRQWNGDRRQDDQDRGDRQRRWSGNGSGQWNGDRGWNGNRGWNDNRGWNGDRGWGRDRAPGWNNRRDSWSSRGDRDWNRQWRQDRRYDWRGWRNDHREIYRMGRYFPPYRSYVYRRLGIGFYLDNGFFGTSYWLNDPWMYRLPPAYGPYRWVRYYDDAVMVNIYSGEVVDVIYDFFW